MFARKPRLATDKGLRRRQLPRRGRAGERRGRGSRSTARAGSAATATPAIRSPPSTSRRPPPRAATARRSTPASTRSPRSRCACRSRPAPRRALTFCTAAADDAATLRAVIDKYRQAGNVERASLMSATLAGIRLREMRINAENFAAIQTLTTALSLSLARTHLRAAEAGDVCDRRLLWRFGISGDRPIVLVSAGVGAGPRPAALAGAGAAPLVVGRRRLRPGRRQPRAGVLPDAAAARASPRCKEAHVAQRSRRSPAAPRPASTCSQSSDLHADEIVDPARAGARAPQRRRPAARATTCRSWSSCTSARSRSARARSVVAARRPTWARSRAPPIAPHGDFAPAGGEFRFDVSALSRPARPWVNVLANPGFGAQISEAGGGYSWALNSRLNSSRRGRTTRRRPGRRVVPAAGPATRARPGA